MKTIFFCQLFFTLIVSSCTNNGKKQLSKSGSSNSISAIDTTKLPIIHDSLFLVSSGQMSFFKTINISGVNFQLVKDIKGDTSFLGTSEKTFTTPEGYSVGASLKQINIKYQRKIKEEPGWGYYVELPSKWTLQFVVGKTATDHPPVHTDTVTYICRRH